jgi:hypothetical protein
MKYSRSDLATIEDVIRVMFETPDEVYSKEWYLRVRDVALEAGVKFRVTSNRRVNVKKSNLRRKPSGPFDYGGDTISRLNGWFKQLYGDHINEHLGLSGLGHMITGNGKRRYYSHQSDKTFLEIQDELDGRKEEPSYHVPIPESTGLAQGFTFMGAIEVLESPYVRPGEAIIFNGQALVAPGNDDHQRHVRAHAAAIAAVINSRPELGVGCEVDHESRTITLFSSRTHNIGRPYAVPIVLEPRKRQKHVAKPSKLPAFIPQRRLDGRRAR